MMKEKQIISQFKALENLKPNQDWVVLTKRDILNSGTVIEQKQRIDFFALFRPRVLAPAAIALAVLLIGAVFIFNINVPFLSFPQEMSWSDYNSLVFSLEKLENELTQTQLSLKNVIDPAKVLEVRERVNSTVAQGEDFVDNVQKKVKKVVIKEAAGNEKDNGEKAKEVVYTALTGIKGAILGLETTYQESLRKLAEEQLKELKKNILTEKQEELVSQAETYYEQGDWAEALNKVIEASQNR